MVTTRPVDDAAIPTLRALACKIWRAYYPGIISSAQIEYMLARMYDQRVILAELAEGVVWEIILRDAEPIGFLSYVYESTTRKLKLNKLYLLPACHGQGIGKRMLQRVKDRAAQLKSRQIYLTVNKQNLRAIRAYERAGFQVTEAVITDIGGGFVMDDYVMVFELAPQDTHES